MLQKYYDDVYAAAAENFNDGTYSDQQTLHRQNLREMADAPDAHPVASRPFASPAGPAQFAGAALGPQLSTDSRMVAAALQPRPYEESDRARAAPFNVRVDPPKSANAPSPDVVERKPLETGGWRKWCRSCGDAKAVHHPDPFGPLCTRPCIKCGAAQDAHTDGNCGYFCMAGTSAASDVGAPEPAADSDGVTKMDGADEEAGGGEEDECYWV